MFLKPRKINLPENPADFADKLIKISERIAEERKQQKAAETNYENFSVAELEKMFSEKTEQDGPLAIAMRGRGGELIVCPDENQAEELVNSGTATRYY